MVFFRASACVALWVLYITPAAGDWLECTANGSDTGGPFAYETTLADVGAVPPDRLAALQQTLVAYVTKQDAEATGVQAACTSFEDQQAAATRYSRTLSSTALRLGWDRVIVVSPESWLSEKDVVSDPATP